PGVSMGLATDGAKICLPNIFSTSVLTASVGGFNSPITLDIASGLPAGATANFSATTINPGETPTLSLDLNGVMQEGTYVINVRAVAAGADTIIRPITLHLTTNDFSGLALLTPADGTTGLSQSQSLHWQTVPDADAYEIELSTSPSFAAGTIVYAKSNWTQDFINVPTFLQKGTAYYWHVRPVNECSPHAWTEPAFFSTFVENCQTFSANDLPKNISANSTPTVESVITINAGGSFNSMNIKQIKGNHQFFKELEFHLLSPAGTDVLLMDGKCGNYSGNFNFGINDDAPGNFPCPPPNNGAAFKATNSLAPFDGQNTTGAWTLRVKDNVIGSSGQLSGYQLEFCSSVSLSPPYITNNKVMSIDPGSNQAVSPDLLQVDDANNNHAQLLFTLATVPQYGNLEKNMGGALHPGDQFTQSDLDGGAIRYYSSGNTTQDGFRFTVTDGEGGFLATPKFLIQPIVGTQEASAKGPAFGIFPNPATETVWIALDQPAASVLRVGLFNVNGQLLQNAEIAVGTDRLSIPVNTLPKGLYMVRLESASAAAVRKLVVE
ncbi:MAG: cadherin-like domain-containing protein, partial [Saprospiraceae bacterium]